MKGNADTSDNNQGNQMASFQNRGFNQMCSQLPLVVSFTQQCEGSPRVPHVFPVVHTFNRDLATHAGVVELFSAHCK